MTALESSIPRITEPKPTHGGAPSHAPPDTRYVPGNSLARFLGYFSIGLGLAEILYPRDVARLSGIRQQGLLQAFGVREIVCGIGILVSSRPTQWLWARVAGDALDLATAGGNFIEAGGDRRGRLLATVAALAGVTALDVLCAGQLTAAAALVDD
jgi:hypothetical protein